MSTLGALLADLSATLGSGGSVLGLVSLLGSSGGLLLILGLLDGLSSGSGTSLGSGGSALLDHVEGSTNDGSLGLDGLACSLLGNLL